MDIDDRRRLYAAEYRKRWAAAKIDPERRPAAFAVARAMLGNRARYEEISRATNGVPWWWIGLAHNRESGMRFDRHLHEGSPLTGQTRDVPKGRPPGPPANGSTYSFFESAVDALTMPGKQYHKIGTWDVVEVFLRLEQYNGFGYRAKGIPSPYLWAGTNQSDERGKYVRDHVFDRNAPEKQLGCAAIMLALRELGVEMFPGEVRPVGRATKVVVAAGGGLTVGAATATAAPQGWTTWEIAAAAVAVVIAAVAAGLIIRALMRRKPS